MTLLCMVSSELGPGKGPAALAPVDTGSLLFTMLFCMLGEELAGTEPLPPAAKDSKDGTDCWSSTTKFKKNK